MLTKAAEPGCGTTARALVYTGPGIVALEDVVLPPLDGGMVEVETLHSGLSRGTERLVHMGQVPPAEHARMRAPHQIGDFPFPVRYGYAAVGRVTAGPDRLLQRTVFALHPHQTSFRVPADEVVEVPDFVPPERAVLAANMETALNALWDAKLAPGARCLVVGAGLVGSLISVLLSRRRDLTVHITDIRSDSVVNEADFRVRFMSPQAVGTHAYDVAFHTSASASGLQTAIDALDFEGRVIELSWYGSRAVEVALGGNFHAGRLQIISSQVGHIAPARRASTDYRGRLGRALSALDDERLDRLITEAVPFDALETEIPRLLAPDAPGIATRIDYR